MQVVAPITSTISAVSFQGLSITTPDGEPVTLAVIDLQGRIVDWRYACRVGGGDAVV